MAIVGLAFTNNFPCISGIRKALLKMRLTFFLALLCMVTLTAGCQSPSNHYLMNGIGAALPAPDIDQAGRLQNAYFNYLCQQAGLVENPFSSQPGTCQIQAMDSGSWNLIVRQGMNDIDRRCDAYLEWLDNKQRSAGPLLNQVRDVQSAVRGIIFAVDPGSTVAMEVVGLAFGLIDRSLQNYNSRLLLLVEPSTRNSVVLNALRDFRRQVKEKNLSFPTRPEAEYALREYMRRCLPFAIEAQINDLSTLGSQGIDPARATTIFEAPVAFQKPRIESSPREPLRPDQKSGTKPSRPNIQPIDQRLSKVFREGPFEEIDLVNLQRRLCVGEIGIEQVGVQTVAGVLIFEATDWGELVTPVKDGKISEQEFRFLSNLAGCDSSQFKNIYESQFLADDATVRGLVTLLNQRFPENPFTGTPSLADPLLRKKIGEARLGYGLSDLGGAAADHVTPELRARLRLRPPS
jgi:hypothetical protein